MTRTPPNNHHTNDSIDFPNEFEVIRFLRAEIQHASLETLTREHHAVFGCKCASCQDARADDGPECGSPAWRSPR
jgi:hypothetical protein